MRDKELPSRVQSSYPARSQDKLQIGRARAHTHTHETRVKMRSRQLDVTSKQFLTNDLSEINSAHSVSLYSILVLILQSSSDSNVSMIHRANRDGLSRILFTNLSFIRRRAGRIDLWIYLKNLSSLPYILCLTMNSRTVTLVV